MIDQPLRLYVPPPGPGPVIAGDKYVPAATIVGAWDITLAELVEMASGEPILIRSVVEDGQTYYSWGDAAAVAITTTRIESEEAEPSC